MRLESFFFVLVDEVMHGTSNGPMILGSSKKNSLPLDTSMAELVKSCHFLRKMLARMERPYRCFQRSGRALIFMLSSRSFQVSISSNL